MKLDVTEEECAIILDGLAALPLARSYNLFTRTMQLFREHQQIKQAAPVSLEGANIHGIGPDVGKTAGEVLGG